jgi:uncharacterized protein
VDGLAIAALLVAYSNTLNLWPPFNGPAYVPFNLTATVVLYLVAVGPLGLERSDLGLTGASAPEIGVAAAAALVITLPMFVAIWRGRALSLLADNRVKGLWGPSLAYQTVVRVPFGTAVLEELAFRGVLLAAWGDLGTLDAVVASSVVFGLWHISPTINLVRANHPGAPVVRTMRTVTVAVLITFVAGAGLAALRLWTGTLLVPLMLHAGVNSLATLAGALAHRQLDRHGRSGKQDGRGTLMVE